MSRLSRSVTCQATCICCMSHTVEDCEQVSSADEALCMHYCCTGHDRTFPICSSTCLKSFCCVRNSDSGNPSPGSVCQSCLELNSQRQNVLVCRYSHQQWQTSGSSCLLICSMCLPLLRDSCLAILSCSRRLPSPRLVTHSSLLQPATVQHSLQRQPSRSTASSWIRSLL